MKKQELETVVNQAENGEGKKRKLLETMSQLVKNSEELTSDIEENIQSIWDSLSDESIADHIRVQLDNEYRQASRNLHKEVERVEAQTKGIEVKQKILAELEELKEANDFKSVSRKIYQLKDEWEDAPYAGREEDSKMSAQFRQMSDEVLSKKDEFFDNLHITREQAKVKKEELIVKAKEASTSTFWKDTAKEMRELMEAWKQAGNAGREIDDELWEQFQGARQAFFDRQEEHFEAMREKQKESVVLKTALVSEAQAICENEDFKETSKQMHELMKQWKAAGYAGKENDDSLWEAFSAARKIFFDRQDSFYKQKQGKFKDSLYSGIKRRNKQVADLEKINADLESQVSEIRNLDPVPGNSEDRWEVMNQRNQDIEKLTEYINENLKKIAVLEEQLKEMNEKFNSLDEE